MKWSPRKKGGGTVGSAAGSEAKGRPLLFYIAPLAVLAALLLFLVALYGSWLLSDTRSESQQAGARLASHGLQTAIEEAVRGRRQALEMLARDAELVKTVSSRPSADWQAVLGPLDQQVPGATAVRLFSYNPDSDYSAQMESFAAADQVLRAGSTGAVPLVEVHRVKEDSPEIAVAVPVKHDGFVYAVLYANFPLQDVTHFVAELPAGSLEARLEQYVAGSAMELAATNGFVERNAVVGNSIGGTIWRLQYHLAGGTAGMAWSLMGLAILGILGTAGLGFWLHQRLHRDIKADLALAVSLMDATLRRSGTPSIRPQLALSNEAVALMVKYAQATFVAAKAGTGAKERDARRAALTAAPAAPQGARAPVGAPIEVPSHVFRAYDIRGLVGPELSAEFAGLLGRALGSKALELGENTLVVARDARLSSQELAEALQAGVLSTGCDVIDIGMAPTPLLYYATQVLNTRSGVMVTGSHNPPEYNGFKIVLNGQSLSEEGLQLLREQMLAGNFESGKGVPTGRDLSDEYIERIASDIELPARLKIVVDAGNGAAGPLASALLQAIGCEVVELYCQPDGNFPNHHPDPSDPDNLSALIMEVQAQGADLGIAFDGDGDRLGVIDDKGKLIKTDLLIMLLARDILNRHPGVDIVFDVKSSMHLAPFILTQGGRPLMWKTGHTRIKQKMAETGALLGGEFSGHLFIKERWFGFDDALYAAARILEILALEARSAASVFEEFPASVSTPEIQLLLEEGRNFALVQSLKGKPEIAGANRVDIDGLRLEFADGWGLIRPSNTTPALVFRFEAKSHMALDSVQARMRELLLSVAPDLKVPF